MQELGNKNVKVGVGVILLKNNKVLLGKRKNAHGEGTWSLPGGKLHFGESVKDCIKREAKEETNLDIEVAKIVSVANDINYETHYITIGVLAKNIKGELKLMEPNKASDWKWFELNNLPKPLFIPSAKIIKNYKNKVIFSDE